jgi:site-specific DNA recombinase
LHRTGTASPESPPTITSSGESSTNTGRRSAPSTTAGTRARRGELTDDILDQLAKYERAKIAERTRRGKLQKVREGKIIATMKPPYGFRYNEARDALVVHEPEKRVVENIFRLAAEGYGTTAIQTRLYREGIPSPRGKEVWYRPVLKRMVLSDVYKPHTYEETMELVPEQVAISLEKKTYGIRWWNRFSRKSRQVSEPTQDGRRHYRRKVVAAPRSRDESIGVPVPAFLPREIVERARAMMTARRPQERKNLARGWKLRGLIRCPSCRGAMTSHTVKRGEKLCHYYRCHRSVDCWRNTCKQRMVRAERAEAAMWGFVYGILKDSDRMRVGMDALIEQKRAETRGDPEREARAWLERLSELDQERRGYLRLAAKGRITDAELDEAFAELEEARRAAEGEFKRLSAVSATASPHSDQASREAVRRLTPPTALPCALALVVTTLLYSATVSRTLQQPLRATNL